jgi:hypothetical protein
MFLDVDGHTMTITGSVPARVSAPNAPAPTAAQTKTEEAKVVAQPSAQPAASASAKQQAALHAMLSKYAYDQSHGIDGKTLSALGKQIMAAAKALGQHVTLPRAPASSSEGRDGCFRTEFGSGKGQGQRDGLRRRRAVILSSLLPALSGIAT